MRQMAGTVVGFPDAAADGGGPVACRPFRVAAGQASDPESLRFNSGTALPGHALVSSWQAIES